MSIDDNFSDINEKNIDNCRKTKKAFLSRLSDYRKDYDSKKFISDLLKYFGDEVDFNLDKVRDSIERPGKLDQLIQRADNHNSHPVVEFIQDIFKESAS